MKSKMEIFGPKIIVILSLLILLSIPILDKIQQGPTGAVVAPNIANSDWDGFEKYYGELSRSSEEPAPKTARPTSDNPENFIGDLGPTAAVVSPNESEPTDEEKDQIRGNFEETFFEKDLEPQYSITGINSSSQSIYEWTMIDRQINHTRHYPGYFNITDLGVKWGYEFGSAARGFPVVYDGFVYVGADDGFFYRIYAHNGTVKDRVAVSGGLRSSPLIYNGTVLFGDLGGTLRAYDIDTWTQDWSYHIGGGVVCSPVVYDGVLYIGSGSTNYKAIYANNGTLKWSVGLPDYSYSSAAVKDGLIYFGLEGLFTGFGHMYALNTTDGSEVWEYSVGDTIKSSPVLVGDRLFFASLDGHIYALDSRTGTYIWDASVGSSESPWATPAYDKGVLYIGTINSEDDDFYAINSVDGSIKWSTRTGMDLRFASPIITDDYVIAGSYGWHDPSYLYIMNVSNGDILDQIEVEDDINPMISIPALANNTLYFTVDNNLFAFEAGYYMPNFNVMSPQQDALYSDQTVPLDLIGDRKVTSWHYDLNGFGNISFSPNTTITAQEGNNSLDVYGTTSSGVYMKTTINFTVDTTPPQITILSPTDGTSYLKNDIFVNATSPDGNGTWLMDYSGQNQSIVINSSHFFPNGQYSLKLWTADSAGNWGVNDSVNFTVSNPLTIEFVNATSPIYVLRNSTTTLLLNVSCNGLDCGAVNISLDPILAGCDPSIGTNEGCLQCSNYSIFKDTGFDNWTHSHSFISFCGSQSLLGNKAYVINDSTCDLIHSGENGQCVLYETPGPVQYMCPGYDRIGRAVTSNDCSCLSGSCTRSFTQIFYLDGEFFSGVSKGGLISNVFGDIPFWTTRPNPTELNLNAGDEVIIDFVVNATGRTGTYDFFAFADSPQLYAESGHIDVKISDFLPTPIGLSLIEPSVGSIYEEYINFSFPVVVNVSCQSDIDCGQVQVVLDPPIVNETYGVANILDDVKYGPSSTPGNGGGQIKWSLPSLPGRSIPHAELCFYNRDDENTQFEKRIWLIDENDLWNEGSGPAVLDAQTKIIYQDTTSTCGTSGCFSCHDVTTLVQKAADLGYTEVTFRIEAVDFPVNTITQVGNHDGLEPGTYWVFDDSESSQGHGTPELSFSSAPGTSYKGIISDTVGDIPFWTNESNPRNVTLLAGEWQLITFWVIPTYVGNYEFFAYVNRTINPADSNRTGSWNVTVSLYSPLNIELLSPLHDIYIKQNKTFDLTFNISCDIVDCGQVNISLDPISGCDPAAGDCTAACADLSPIDRGTGWHVDNTFGPNICINGSSIATPNNIFGVAESLLCSSWGLAGSGSDCAVYAFNQQELLVCPSYDRLGNKSVTWQNCTNTTSGYGRSDFLTHFDFSNDFFSGPCDLNYTNDYGCGGCGELFVPENSGWSYKSHEELGPGAPELCIDDSFTFVTVNSSYCDQALNNDYEGDCASIFQQALNIQSICPSYARLQSPVTFSDCTCVTPGDCSSHESMYNFSATWFAGEPEPKGLVSMVFGDTPFWTSSSNPVIAVLNTGQSLMVSYTVNATGALDSSYEFFAFADNGSYYAESDHLWVSIVNDTNEPEIEFVYPTPNDNAQTLDNNISINVSIADDNVDSISISLNDIYNYFYDDSLVLMYNFENNTGVGDSNDTVFDLSGNGHHASVENTAQWISGGRHGGAYEFDGGEENLQDRGYLLSPSSSDFFISDGFTVEVWFKKYSSTENDMASLVTTKDWWNTNENWYLDFPTNERLQWGIGNTVAIGSSEPIMPGHWHHAVGIYDNGVAKFYLDGELQGIDDSVSVANELHPLVLGRGYSTLNGWYFNGTIDELRIYQRALDEDEVRLHYLFNLMKLSGTEWSLYGNITDLASGEHNYGACVLDSYYQINCTNRSITIIDNIELSLDYPIASIEVLQNSSFQVVLNVTCNLNDCGNLNVTLDPISGCDPALGECSESCANFLNQDSGSGWRHDTSFGVGLCVNGSSLSTISNIYAIGDSNACGFWSAPGSGSDCAMFAISDSELLSCPSYERLGNNSVSWENCSCTLAGGCVESDYTFYFNFSNEFFSGPCDLESNECGGCYKLFTPVTDSWQYFPHEGLGGGAPEVCTESSYSYYVINSTTCDTLLPGAYGDCATVYNTVEGDQSICPSYARLGHSVTYGDCVCDTGDCSGHELLYNFADAWFAGGSDSQTKSIVSMLMGSTPFWTNTSNPYGVSLIAGQSEFITFWVNATGSINGTHEFFAFTKMDGETIISNSINVTIVGFNDTVENLSINISFEKTANATVSIPNDEINWSIFVHNHATDSVNVTINDTNGLFFSYLVLLPDTNRTLTYVSNALCEDINNTAYLFLDNGTLLSTSSWNVTVVSCGDGLCNCNETYLTCPSDCSEAPPGSGCSEDWVCEEWGPCLNGFRARDCDCGCADLNDCGPEPEIRSACECEKDKDCEDNNKCTANYCFNNSCVFTPRDGKSCDDGDDCTINDVCENGICVGVDVCGSPNPQDDRCIPEWDCTGWSDCSLGMQRRDCHCTCESCEDEPPNVRACSEDLNLILNADAVVVGDELFITVTDAKGNPVDATIRVVAPDGAEWIIDGSIYVPNISGQYMIYASKEGYDPARDTVIVRKKTLDLASEIVELEETIKIVLKDNWSLVGVFLLSLVLVFLLLLRRKKRKEERK